MSNCSTCKKNSLKKETTISVLIGLYLVATSTYGSVKLFHEILKLFN